ncbi:MAG: HFX_2341 family transcriptional regulator domain-containing protein [Promethearchaeota archaeon]
MQEITVETSLQKEKIHVAFLGWEIERIVEPVIKMRGDRLILICMPKKEEGAWKYLEEIVKRLEKTGKKVDVIENSLYKMVSLLSILNKIFQVERERGNEIFINVSAGTKVTACASTIAAMAHPAVTAYYVRTREYYPRENLEFPLTLTRGIEEIYTLPECQIELPDDKFIQTLHVIQKISRRGDNRVYLKELIPELKDKGLIKVKFNSDHRRGKSSQYMATLNLTRNLVKWGYITISPKKRNKYLRLTKKGKDAVQMYLNYKIDEQVLKKHENMPMREWIEILKEPGKFE